MAAFDDARRYMPNVYRESFVAQEELEKFPLEGEQEMLKAEERVDLQGEVRLEREVFRTWLDAGRGSKDYFVCAQAVMRDALDQQGADLRGAVTSDTAWELACRILSQPEGTKTLGTGDLAQLLVYWLEEGQLPCDMHATIYEGMVPELHERGKTVQTDDDEQAMKCRWVKQSIHQELDLAREAFLGKAEDAPIDLEAEFEVSEAPQQSVVAETEREASKVMECLAAEEEEQWASEQEWYDAWDGQLWRPDGEWAGWVDAWREDWYDAWESDDWKQRVGHRGEAVEAAVAQSTAAEAPKPPAKGNALPDKPLVDPPELSDRIRDTDKEPYWIPGAYPTIFQNETGDPHNYVLKEPDLVTWGPHILRSKGWHAQAHMTFMYWWMNMIQRFQALGAKKWFVKDNPKATGYTAQELKTMSVSALAKQMVGYTANIPGTKASKARIRKLILAMVKQIEIETRSGNGDHAQGDVPCLFGTLTSQRYQWDEIIRIIAQVEGIADYKSISKSKHRELVNKYPLFVAWYCAVRLELTLKTIVVPILGASAFMGVFEWSPTGAMVHLHYVAWVPGAPRFDLRAETLQRDADALRRAGLVASGHARCKIDDVVEFFAQYVSEWNPNKTVDGIDRTSHVAECVNEARPHTASVSVEEMLQMLDASMADQRHEYYNRMVRTEHMHDFHYPDPLGAPNPSQPCAKLLKGTLNMWYCGNGFPMDLVTEASGQAIAQDALRPDLWRCHLVRNCRLMNSHMPGVSFGLQSNDDSQPVVTKHQSLCGRTFGVASPSYAGGAVGMGQRLRLLPSSAIPRWPVAVLYLARREHNAHRHDVACGETS